MRPANRLKIKTLGSGWEDKDQVMLHACFQLLEDFIVEEGAFTEVDWNWGEEHRAAKKELVELHEWWINRVKKMDNFLIEDMDKQEKEDEEMLLRLIKIRPFMWT